MELIQNILILFVVGSFSGFLNVMAGGGSAFTLPTLIFLGLDSAVANGTNRIAILAQSIAAIISFKNENYFDIRTSLILSLFTIPGSITGAFLSINISSKLFNILLGVVNLFIILTLFLPKRIIKVSNKPEKINWKLAISLVFIGFYGGFIQVAAGFMLMAAIQNFLKVDLIRVNMYKVFIALIFTIPAFVVFLVNGKMDFILGIALASGNFFGAWQSAKISVKKGEKIIRYFLIIAIIIISLKLFGLF